MFIDADGNEYFWPKADDVVFGVAPRHFRDELGYNDRLRYMITSKEIGEKRVISGIHGIK